MQVDAQIAGLANFQRFLGSLEADIARVQAGALNDVAYNDILPAQKMEMQRVFRKPTPYTLRSTLYRKGTAQRPQTTVFIRKARGDKRSMDDKGYLGPQVFGGSREDKSSEKRLRAAGILPPGMQMVPGPGAKRDRYGNVPGGRWRGVVNALIGGGGKAARGRYFVGRVGNNLAIWQEVGGRARIIFFFVENIRYKAIYDFDGVTEKALDRNYERRYDARMDRAIARASRR